MTGLHQHGCTPFLPGLVSTVQQEWHQNRVSNICYSCLQSNSQYTLSCVFAALGLASTLSCCCFDVRAGGPGRYQITSTAHSGRPSAQGKEQRLQRTSAVLLHFDGLGFKCLERLFSSTLPFNRPTLVDWQT